MDDDLRAVSARAQERGHIRGVEEPTNRPHLYICVTDGDEPDNMVMAQMAEVALLVRRSGQVLVWKDSRRLGDLTIDVSVPERDWSYSLVPV